MVKRGKLWVTLGDRNPVKVEIFDTDDIDDLRNAVLKKFFVDLKDAQTADLYLIYTRLDKIFPDPNMVETRSDTKIYDMMKLVYGEDFVWTPILNPRDGDEFVIHYDEERSPSPGASSPSRANNPTNKKNTTQPSDSLSTKSNNSKQRTPSLSPDPPTPIRIKRSPSSDDDFSSESRSPSSSPAPSATSATTTPTNNNAANRKRSSTSSTQSNAAVKRQRSFRVEEDPTPGGTGKKPKKRYVCEECDGDFSTSGHLARHRRIHTGVKPYVCLLEGCNKQFSRLDNMMQHYRSHMLKRQDSVGPSAIRDRERDGSVPPTGNTPPLDGITGRSNGMNGHNNRSMKTLPPLAPMGMPMQHVRMPYGNGSNSSNGGNESYMPPPLFSPYGHHSGLQLPLPLPLSTLGTMPLKPETIASILNSAAAASASAAAMGNANGGSSNGHGNGSNNPLDVPSNMPLSSPFSAALAVSGAGAPIASGNTGGADGGAFAGRGGLVGSVVDQIMKMGAAAGAGTGAGAGGPHPPQPQHPVQGLGQGLSLSQAPAPQSEHAGGEANGGR
ncbi:hypothetical protein HK097_004481 [Rhizophlyctis rosea]|uniref:C2H2-type domain-containing protein n=1 Tax=Rhizophlyctis rosea TaxID=64517 RepID=A0AAD5X5U0_9FUNG|nr:hypothetical protein HK097_004481 [Rhizophlyctis rosea]